MTSPAETPHSHVYRCHICWTPPGWETTNARCQSRGCELECIDCGHRPDPGT